MVSFSEQRKIWWLGYGIFHLHTFNLNKKPEADILTFIPLNIVTLSASWADNTLKNCSWVAITFNPPAVFLALLFLILTKTALQIPHSLSTASKQWSSRVMTQKADQASCKAKNGSGCVRTTRWLYNKNSIKEGEVWLELSRRLWQQGAKWQDGVICLKIS